jgi:single stranded DNA-binding protein
MSHIEVHQIGHVAALPIVETLSGNGHPQTKALVTVISNARWRDREGEVRQKATAITWTLWGKSALNASWYLNTGSKVAVTGRVESHRYTGKDGKEVSAFTFTTRSVEYLESKAQAEARRNRPAGSPSRQGRSPAGNAAGKSPRATTPAKEG